MNTVQVSGGFMHKDGSPVEGKVRFTPSQLWFEEDGIVYANIAREVQLVNGDFCVYLSRTDATTFPWHYTMDSPLGKWSVFITNDGPIKLMDLLPKRIT